MRTNGIEKVGVIGVDAGICWIGDPCYILHRSNAELQEMAPSIGSTWSEFCDKLEGHTKQFDYPLGHPGLGVVVSTGYGDGEYPVYVEYRNGVVVRAWVEFDGGEVEEDSE